MHCSFAVDTQPGGVFVTHAKIGASSVGTDLWFCPRLKDI